MSINKINEEILNEIKSDENFKNELSEFLNQVIDEEIEKGDEMDDELVSECVNALMELEEGKIEEAVSKLGSSAKIIKFVHKKNFERKNMTRSIAAAIALILLTSGVALQTNPVFAEKAKDFFNQIINALSIGDKETDDGTTDVVALYGVFDESPDYTIKDESEIDLSGLKIYAINENGDESEVKLSDCKLQYHRTNDENKKKIIAVVSYKGCSFSINYTVED